MKHLKDSIVSLVAGTVVAVSHGLAHSGLGDASVFEVARVGTVGIVVFVVATIVTFIVTKIK